MLTAERHPQADKLQVLAPLPVSKVWGVGKVTERHLQALGIRTVGDLQQYPIEELRRQIGNTADTEGGGQALRPIDPGAIGHILRWTGAPEMMKPADVAEAVAWALSTPSSVRLDRIVMRERAEIPT